MNERTCKASIVTFLLCTILSIAGCSEDIIPDPVDIEFRDVVLNTTDRGWRYSGEIPPEGADFSITSSRPITCFNLNKVVWLDQYGKPDLSGNWGNITYVTQAPPYHLIFHIAPLENGGERTFVITLGGEGKLTKITLKQAYN